MCATGHCEQGTVKLEHRVEMRVAKKDLGADNMVLPQNMYSHKVLTHAYSGING